MTTRDYRHCGHLWLWSDCYSCQQQRYREDRQKREDRRRAGKKDWSWRSLL